MVVEDEYLVAMDMQLALEQNGFEVVGPFRTVGETLRTLQTCLPDAAILDWNLGTENSESIARALKESGVPFMLSTGYAANYFAGSDCADVP